MLLTILILFVAIVIYGLKEHIEGIYITFFIFSVIILIAIIIVFGFRVSSSHADSRIEYLIEDREETTNTLWKYIERYMEHEENVFDKNRPEDLLFLLERYPTLSSAPLVQEQLEHHTYLQSEIRRLELQKRKLPIYDWWLSFNIF